MEIIEKNGNDTLISNDWRNNMLSTKNTFLGLLAFIMVFGAAQPGYAADNHDNKQKTQTEKTQHETQSKAPIVIEGDDLSFSDVTGQVFAKGNVSVTQNGAKITTDLIEGNTKQSLIWTDSPATFTETEQKVYLVGTGIHYNYKDKTGNIQKASGQVDKERVSGQNIEMLSTDEIIIRDGTMTRCPAKVPDYHVSAEKIELWPGEKMIAYNAKVWIKNVVIYSTPKYQTMLGKNAGKTEYPRVGYNNHDGLAIKQYLEYPLSDKVAAFADLHYYSKEGFKPQYGVVDRESRFEFKTETGYFEDDDDNWIKKEPEFSLKYHPQRLGNLPIKYTFNAIYGKWDDNKKSSWHQDYTIYFSHDPIKLNDTLTLNAGAGREWIHESYDDSTQNIVKFDTTLTKQWSSRWSTWVGYHYTKNNTGLFDYNSADMGRELDTGFSYKIDRMNTIVFNQRYDLGNDRVYDQDYTWKRNLHCWEADITYRAKRHEIKWDVSVARW